MTDDAALVLRPPRRWRIYSWSLAAFSALFGLCALAGDDLGGEVTMGAGALVFVLVGISSATSRVECTRRGLRVRSLWWRFVPANEIASVEVSGTDFGYGRRVGIEIRRRKGRALKPPALARYDTRKNHDRATADAEAIRQTLGFAAG